MAFKNNSKRINLLEILKKFIKVIAQKEKIMGSIKTIKVDFLLPWAIKRKLKSKNQNKVCILKIERVKEF